MKKVLFVVFVFALSASTIIAQQQHRKYLNKKGGDRLERLEKTLSEAGLPLSADQSAEIKAIMDTQIAEMQQMGASDESPEVLREQRRASMKAAREKMNAVLTAEQSEVVKRNMQAHREERMLHRRARMKENMEKMQMELQKAGVPLSETQKTDLRSLAAAERDAMKALREQTTAREAFRTEAQRLREEYRTRRAEILTPEQLEVVEAMRADRPRKMEKSKMRGKRSY